MKDIIRKLTSRKLWLAVAGVGTGMLMILGGDSADVNTIADSIKAVAGAITSLFSIITYIKTEGKIDAARVGNTVQQIVEKVEDVVDETVEIKDTIMQA